MLLVLFVLYGHGSLEVSINLRIVEIDLVADVVGQNERENGVLHEIVVRSSGQFVEARYVFPVCERTAAPECESLAEIVAGHPSRQVASRQFSREFISFL